jgi:hypothetical protein
MKSEALKELLIRSVSGTDSSDDVRRELEEAGVNYSFSEGFTSRVMARLTDSTVSVRREIDFLRSFNRAFYRIALTGVAAIVILLISIFIMEGSISLGSFVGLSDSYDEGIVYLLTGN